MPNDIVILNSEVLLVADDCRKQQAKAVLLCPVRNNKEKLVCISLRTACLENKENHYIYTRHKNSMKRLLNQKIMFRDQNKKFFYA